MEVPPLAEVRSAAKAKGLVVRGSGRWFWLVDAKTQKLLSPPAGEDLPAIWRAISMRSGGG
jgi:hypothetical protein